jgi:hypothetical protein
METEAVLRLQLGPQLGFQTGPVDTARWFCPECKAWPCCKEFSTCLADGLLSSGQFSSMQVLESACLLELSQIGE